MPCQRRPSSLHIKHLGKLRALKRSSVYGIATKQPCTPALRSAVRARAADAFETQQDVVLSRASDGVAAPQHSSAAHTRFTLLYETGWRQCRIHYSAAGAPWTTRDMLQVAHSQMMSVTLDIESPNQQVEFALEFVLTDGNNDWDNNNGRNYKVQRGGTYSLSQGTLNSIRGRRVLVVTDLDGTLIGDDDATNSFRCAWAPHATMFDSKLVFNSGRTMESIKGLMREKQHCIPVPHACICSVGTRIYMRDAQTQHAAIDSGWEIDGSWSKQLDEGWNLEAVRDAAYSALAKVGKDRMHFRPPEEQNEHKVTCGVMTSVVQDVTSHIESRIASAGVTANIIVSGAGDWRFMDLVPKRAGKHEALEHVRKRFGFESHETIACGDSGNDILMLSGTNLAIAVGNSQDDLRKWVVAQLAAEGTNGDGSCRRLILTKQPMAFGILEGLKTFEFM